MIYIIIWLCGVAFSTGLITGESDTSDAFDCFFVFLWPLSWPLFLIFKLGEKAARWL